jgi:hypothetical protein
VLEPHEHEKYYIDVSHLGCIGMRYVTRISHGMQKHKFDVTCPALFMETAPVPPQNQKYFVDVSCPRGTRMHYVTRRYHQMQKHKFNVTCPDSIFIETTPFPPEHEK